MKVHEKSFDTSAQIEELFDAQCDDNLHDIIKIDSSQNPKNRDIVEIKGAISGTGIKCTVERDIVIEPQHCVQDHRPKKIQTIVTKIPTKLG